ncbi:unnamed protein product, partial [marine sediment metagenome]
IFFKSQQNNNFFRLYLCKDKNLLKGAYND